MLIDRVLRSRPCRETQREDRIHFQLAVRPYRIHIRTRTPDFLATPGDRVAFAGRQLLGVLVGLRGGWDDRNGDLINAVTTLNGRQTVIIYAVRRDVLTVPVKHLALRPLFALAEVVRLRFVQVDSFDTVTTRRQRYGVINDCRIGVRRAVPFGLAAEHDRTNRTLYRYYRQGQFVNAVFACMCLIFNAIRVRSRDTAQACQTVPGEVITLTDSQLF